jgi:hypothetical protein
MIPSLQEVRHANSRLGDQAYETLAKEMISKLEAK